MKFVGERCRGLDLGWQRHDRGGIAWMVHHSIAQFLHHTFGCNSCSGKLADAAHVGEILEELVRCQNELKALSNHNLTQLKRLLKAAKEEMARQEVRNKLQQADNEVMEAYKKTVKRRNWKTKLRLA